jgi:hypothetical protein
MDDLAVSRVLKVSPYGWSRNKGAVEDPRLRLKIPNRVEVAGLGCDGENIYFASSHARLRGDIDTGILRVIPRKAMRRNLSDSILCSSFGVNPYGRSHIPFSPARITLAVYIEIC